MLLPVVASFMDGGIPMRKVDNGNPVCDGCGETVGIVHRTVPKGQACKEWFCDDCMNEKDILPQATGKDENK